VSSFNDFALHCCEGTELTGPVVEVIIEKSCLSYSFSICSFYKKKLFHYFLNNCKHIIGVGMLYSCMGTFPRKEGGTQVLAGLAPSNLLVGSLLRTTLPFR
jgi:hypothetical protein